jgi:hypothetical protein
VGSLTGIGGSNSVECMCFCLLLVLSQVRFERGAGHLSRGVLPSVVCLSVIVRRPWPARSRKVYLLLSYTILVTRTNHSSTNIHLSVRVKGAPRLIGEARTQLFTYNVDEF